MFVERLIAGLVAPQGRLGELDDALVVDIDHYRALLMREARLLSETGQIEQTLAGWAFTCIADGWVDEHLHYVRDGLLELGAISDQSHLDRLLRAAVLHILGTDTGLPPADLLVLETVIAPQPLPGTSDTEPLGMRLMARHYARELGLLSRTSGVTERTQLGDVALKLPRHNVPAYLLALEVLQSAGASDRWRTPRRTLAHLVENREFDVPTTAQGRRMLDPEGLLPWRRVRRLTLMGLCEPISDCESAEQGRVVYRYRLLPYGEEALRQVLREPPSEMVRLAESLLAEQTRQALRPLLSRSRTYEVFPNGHRPGAPPDRPPQKGEPAPHATMRPAVPVPHRPAAPSVPMKGPGSTSNANRVPPAQQELSPAKAPQAPPPTVPAPVPVPLQVDLSVAPDSGPVPVAPAMELSEGRSEPIKEMQALQDLDLCHILQRAWDEIQARPVAFTLLGPSVRVLGDRRALLQACRELLRSAADAAQQGPATPAVTVEVIPSDEEAVLLVHDNGPPMSAADREGVLDVSLGLLSEGPRTGLLRAHRALVAQGAGMSLLPSRLGGTSVRVLIPRAPRYVRRAAA